MTTYQQYEASPNLGEPLEIYRVIYGATIITLGSGDTPVVHAGETYLPSTMKRNEVVQTQEMSKSVLMLTTSKNNPIAALFLTGSPQFPVFITIFRQHTSIAGSDYVTTYKGRITNCRFTKFEAELNCEPIFTSLKRPGLRIKYEPTCANGLYDPGCTLNKNNFAVPGVISAILDGGRQFTITAAGTHPNGYFTGGIMSLNGQGMIADHVGTTITLIRYANGVVGDNVILYPGCNHNPNTCQTTFNNINNFRGFPWMASRNPFTDNSINYIN
jgi:uncharacterized phage protein (TIGR02218 family)